MALGGNPIKTLEEVKVLSKLRELKEVDFIQCPVSELPDYRQKVYEIIEGLDILDNCDKEGNQVADDEDVNHLLIQEDDEDDEEGEDEDEDEEEDGIYHFYQNMTKKTRMKKMKTQKNNVFYLYFRALKKFKKMIL